MPFAGLLVDGRELCRGRTKRVLMEQGIVGETRFERRFILRSRAYLL